MSLLANLATRDVDDPKLYIEFSSYASLSAGYRYTGRAHALDQNFFKAFASLNVSVAAT